MITDANLNLVMITPERYAELLAAEAAFDAMRPFVAQIEQTIASAAEQIQQAEAVASEIAAERDRLVSALAGVREASQPIVDLLDAIDASEFARGAFARYDDDAALYEYLGGGEYVKVTWSQIRALRAAALPPGGGDTNE